MLTWWCDGRVSCCWCKQPSGVSEDKQQPAQVDYSDRKWNFSCYTFITDSHHQKGFQVERAPTQVKGSSSVSWSCTEVIGDHSLGLMMDHMLHQWVVSSWNDRHSIDLNMILIVPWWSMIIPNEWSPITSAHWLLMIVNEGSPAQLWWYSCFAIFLWHLGCEIYIDNRHKYTLSNNRDNPVGQLTNYTYALNYNTPTFLSLYIKTYETSQL